MVAHVDAPPSARRVRLPGRAAVALVALLLAMTGGMATMTPGSVSAMSDDQPPADAGQAWAARPAFVHVSTATEEAYAYALYHPQVIRLMPCYCGCVGMGHRSNLDCYEEHESYCDVCVQITLQAKKLISEGRSLREVRATVEQTYARSAPGTKTDLPPA